MENRIVIPGGSALNSSRAAAYFIDKDDNKEKSSSLAYMGCIG